jgi:hypothetical protein
MGYAVCGNGPSARAERRAQGARKDLVYDFASQFGYVVAYVVKGFNRNVHLGSRGDKRLLAGVDLEVALLEIDIECVEIPFHEKEFLGVENHHGIVVVVFHQTEQGLRYISARLFSEPPRDRDYFIVRKAGGQIHCLYPSAHKHQTGHALARLGAQMVLR